MSDIFLSYRRGDEPGYVGRLADGLTAAFGEVVFRDVDSIRAGDKWKLEIQKQVSQAKVLIAVIGPRWQSILAERDPERDHVRYELNLADELEIPVIPVRIQDAQFDHGQDLGDLHWLRELQFFELADRQRRWATDLEGLVESIGHVTSLKRVKQQVQPPAEVAPPPINQQTSYRVGSANVQDVSASRDVNIHIGDANNAPRSGARSHRTAVLVAVIGATGTVLAALIGATQWLMSSTESELGARDEPSGRAPAVLSTSFEGLSKVEYSGEAEWGKGDQDMGTTPFSLTLNFKGSDVEGKYFDGTGDRGTLILTLKGNSLDGDVVSERAAGRCEWMGILSVDAAKLDATYHCRDGERGTWTLVRTIEPSSGALAGDWQEFGEQSDSGSGRKTPERGANVQGLSNVDSLEAPEASRTERPNKSGNLAKRSVQADGGAAAGDDINVGRDLNVGVTSEKPHEAVMAFARVDLDARRKGFVELLKYRATIIREELFERGESSTANKFDDLHRQHVSSLLRGDFAVAHEIAGEIHSLLYRNAIPLFNYSEQPSTPRPVVVPGRNSWVDGLADRLSISVDSLNDLMDDEERDLYYQHYYHSAPPQ